jgi:hypothetical protein
MFLIEPCQLPDGALLSTYIQKGAYTDCYKTEIPKTVTHAQYVNAFYTTSIFKLERLILKWAVSRPSSDAQATQLAEGAIDTFSAWSVEKRCKNQLLMCDFQGRTRSWLMIELVENGSDTQTRLYFGSAVVPAKNKKTGKSSFGMGFYALLGFHKIYSIVLLYSAKVRLKVQ